MKSVITCDMEGRVLTMNSGAESIFGYNKSEIIGKKRVSIFSPGEIVIQNVGNWLATADKFGEYVGQTYFIKKDGTKINAKIRITPTFSDGKSSAQTGYCGVTEPIDKNIDVPINISTKIIKGIAITRVPFTSVSILPILTVSSYYAGIGDGLFSVFNLILAVIGVLLLHLSSNVYNDYFDVKDGTDEANNEYFQPGGASISGGSRAIELGIITLQKTKNIARILLLLSLFVSSFLFYNIYQITGSLINIQGSLVVGLLGLFLGYFYTATPLRLVSRKGIGELSIFLAFGPLLTLGTGYAISVESIELYSNSFYSLLLIGVPFGLLTTNILFINQFPDAKSDASTGKNHLVVTFGKKASRWIYLLFLTLAFLSSFYLIETIKYSEYFNLNIFIIGNALLYIFVFTIFLKLLTSNINTIILQTLFSFFYIIVLNLFFI
jgi:1,4-dihydroxy-2-naphthoate octaprenyltransferase